MHFIGGGSRPRIGGARPGVLSLWKQSGGLLFTFLLVAIGGMVLLPAKVAHAQSVQVTVGYRDFSYATAVDEQPAGEKPESKLWWNDGFWWGSLWNASTVTYSIHRFNVATQSWVNTGVALDNRGQSKADALWDGTHLYIASHYYTLTAGPASSGQEARLYRYSYNTGTNAYSLDANFPVIINNSISEILVLDKDSTGQLWITWTENGVVKINRSLGNDETWGTPFDLPVQGNNAIVDDISSIVAFDDSKIGVMWSNRNDEKAYFAVHLDSDVDTVWQSREEANAEPSLGAVADDHINLKVACDDSGNVYAATKTRFAAPESPHIYLLRRTPDGTWSRHLFAKVKDGHTRPIVMVDDENGRLYCFATSDVNGKDEMFMKSADLNDLVFPAGVGTAFIQSATDLKVNNATSTKQCVNSETGLLVVADDHNSHSYLHNFIDLASSGDPLIDSFLPTSALVGTQVTISGSNFLGATGVYFNGTSAMTLIVDSETQLRTIVPAGATTGKITVATVGETTESANDFTVMQPPPMISSFTPGSGPEATEVTITGSNLLTTSDVKFNGVSASTISIDSDTQIRAKVPSGATTGVISVTTDGGTTSSVDDFTFIASTSFSFSPAHDSYVRFSTVTDNFGTVPTLRGRALGSDTLNAFLKFDVTGLVGEVLAAKLRLYVVNASADGGTVSLVSNNFAGTGTPWTEAGLQWVNAPLVGSSALSAVGSVAVNDVVEFNVASAITGDGTYSFGLKNNSSDDVHYSSKEGANPPQLIIQTGTASIPAPTISSFTPTSGTENVEVTISGNNFTGASAVKFNGTPASSFLVDSATQIRANVPTGASTGKISVTTLGGVAFSSADFTFIPPAPVVNSFAPASGIVGTEVTITGSNFNLATSVLFNGIAAAFFTIDSAAQIRASVPSGSTTGKITVQNSFGGSGLSASDFLVIASPSIASFTPESGIVGVEVTITGSSLTGVTDVKFNGVSASTFVIDSATQLRAEVPSSASTGQISVTNAAGTAASVTNFTVVASTSTTFLPVHDAYVRFSTPLSNFATTITLRGRASSLDTLNSFLKFAVTGLAGTVQNAKIRMRVTNASNSGGSIYVATNNLNGSATLWAQTDLNWGTTPQIIGVAFSSVGAVAIDDVVDFNVTSAITGNGTYSFALKSSSGDDVHFSSKEGANPPELIIQTGSGPIPSPSITSFTPSSGVVGAEVTITGSNLTGASSVKFNDISATSFLVDSDTKILADVPSGASTGKISVTTDGGIIESANDFTVTVPAPGIASFSPSSGVVGTEVTITGDDFEGATAVQFNGIAASSYTVDSSTQIRANVPAGAITGKISVTTAGGTAQSVNDFTITIPLPTITSFTPTSGLVGAEITISGSNLTGATAAQFNGASASSFTVDTATQIRATVPSGATTGKLAVTTDGGTAQSANDFTAIIPIPIISSFTPTSGSIGDEVTISGSNFTGASPVQFNGVDAASFAVDSDTQIRATVPVGATTGTISVTTSAGTGTSANDFLVTSTGAVTLTFAPAHDAYVRFSTPLSNFATAITLRGRSSSLDTLNSFLKFNVGGISGTVLSAKLRLHVTNASNSGGSIYVGSNNLLGTGTPWAQGDLNWNNAPQITGPALSNSGAAVAGQWIEFNVLTAITGNGTYTFALKSGSTDDVHYSSNEGANPPQLEIQTSSGSIPAPLISSFWPASGVVDTEVTITGSNFTGASLVKFDGLSTPSFVVHSDSEIRAEVPTGALTGKISVTTGGGTAMSATDFIVTFSAPAIGSFSPTNGVPGTVVTIVGDNFNGSTAVQFNGLAASTFIIDSATQLRATVPAGATTGKIGVTTPGGSGLSVNTFTVNAVSGAPTITSFSPTNGLAITLVTITGTNFNGTTSVKFNGTEAPTFVVDTNTQIRVSVPAGATTGKISVTNAASTVFSATDFVVIPPPPSIASFTPSSGLVGIEITITGNNFGGASAVQFNGVSASTFTVNSATQIRANVPVGATTGKINVTTGGGTALSATDFTVIPPAPIISSFSPSSGLVGIQVTVTGSNFSGASSVQFNGTTASTFVVDTATQIRVTVPVAATTGKISVTTLGGTAVSANDFVMTPIIASFTPASGVIGTQVTITGSHFTGATAVQFNGIAASTFTVDSATQVRANVPAGATTGKINVTTGGGTAISAGDFMMTPVIVSFTPAFGMVGGEVTITGNHFIGATSVKFNSSSATTFTVDSNTQIRANVPAGSTTGKISVTTSGGTGVSADDFVMTPIIASFTPTSGVAGTEVTITGSHFMGATAAQFNGVAASTFTIDSAAQIRATVPGATTTGKISVTTLGGTALSAVDFVVIPPAPIISSFNPISGLMGTQVTITGSNFSNTSSVKFNGVEAASFILDSATQIRATLPIGAGTGKISVTTPGGPGLSATAFIVPEPTIASFGPPTALEGEQVIITGANFTGTMSVAFNGTTASIFIVDSATQIRALVPDGASTGKISVTTGGGTALSADDFVLSTLKPIISSFTPMSGLAGVQVTITGGNFADVTSVKFNGSPASTFSIPISTQILATVPAGATTGKIALTNPHGTTLSINDFAIGPVITSFTPNNGLVGIEVTITGNNFSGATALQFNGTPASTYIIDSSSQIRATVAAGSTTGKISVTTAVNTVQSATNFTVIPPAPILTSFSPGSGLVGAEVTIVGNNLLAASDVKFHTTSASTYVVDSATQIRAIVPDGASSGKISITTLGGTALSAADFTVILSAPIISSFLPSSGVVGVEVTISGSHLNGASEVKFNTTSASAFIVDSPSQIRATLPAGATTGKISVTTPGGTGVSINDFVVTAPAPTITSFTPSSGQVGVEVTITGGNLTTTTEIKFNGTSASTFTIDSATQIRANVPAAATSGKVSLTTGGGTVISTADFTVLPPAPTIASFSPASGVIGTEVTITGGNFSGASAVKFNGTNAAFIIDSATLIRANAPSGATTGKMSVTGPGGTTLTLTDFTVTLLIPTITSLTPDNGIVGLEVTITGTNFTGATQVKFNGTSASTFTVDFASQIRANVPTGATTGKISVTTAGGIALSATDFALTLPSPTISSFTPTNGVVGTEVTIAGTNFASATDVKFNTTSASIFTIDSATQIRANVPSGASVGKISITTPGGTAVSATDFTVTTPSPTITSFTPSSALVGIQVTITGTNFTGATEVKFNSTMASTFTVDSAIQISATVPAGATTGKISVTTAGGTAQSGSDFTVTLSSPAIASFSPTSGLVGIQITITGSNFTGASSVMFNATNASSFIVDSATQIRVTVPVGATTGKISVTTTGGTALSVTDFSVIPPAPVISSFSPSSGLVGTEVTITGSDFAGATSVMFNGTSASTFTIDSPLQIRAFVPGGASNGKISVTTGGGTVLSATNFTISSGAPVTEVFFPLYDSYVRLSTPTSNYGSVTSLRLRDSGGDKLNSYLKFDVTNITGPVTSAKLRMNVTEASVNGGSVYIVSNYYLGTSSPWTQSGINWNNAPAVSGSPINSMGPVALGEVVEFDVTSAVTGNGLVSFALTTTSSDMAQYSSQEGSIKPELVVEYGGGALPVPAISSFTPTTGAVSIQVTITGANFSGASSVKFNGVAASNFTVDSATQIRANVPAGATTGKISVTTAGGIGTSIADFTVTTPPSSPTISSFTPASGVIGAEVTVSGNNFSGTTAVQFNGVFASAFTVDSNTQLRVTVPAGATTGKINVTTGGGTATSVTDFTVTVGGTFTERFVPLYDTYVRLATPTSNFGTTTAIRLRKSSSDDLDSYLKFDVAGITGTVISAKLRMKVLNASNDGGEVHVVSNFYKNTTTPWTQSGMNWNNAPPLSGSALSTHGPVAIDAIAEFDVTAAISGNGTFSFGLSNNSTDDVHYSSQEGTTKPELLIEYSTGAPAAPSISSFNPASGAVGAQITVSGNNFTGATAVQFNGTAASTFTLDSATQIRANVPTGASTGKISVTTPGGTALSAGNFTVTASPSAPTITSFTPASGIVGIQITIIGANFSGASGVKVNATFASSFIVDTATQIRATVPSGATSGKISVITAGGTAVSASDFTVSGGSTLTATIEPYHDAFVRQSTPTTVYGDNTSLRVRWNSTDKMFSFMKFHVTGINGAVVSAKVRLKVTNASVDGGSIYSVSNKYAGTATDWLEDGINWNNAPLIPDTPLGSVGPVSVGGIVEFDVTAAIAGNGTYSFGMSNQSSDDAHFISQEGAVHPQLIIQYTSATLARSGDGVDDEAESILPKEYGLSQNYPNPFNGQTTIEYALPEMAKVRLVIYNTLGQMVRKLVDETQSAGYKHTVWDGRDEHGESVGSGVYFYQLETGQHRFNGRMSLQQ